MEGIQDNEKEPSEETRLLQEGEREGASRNTTSPSNTDKSTNSDDSTEPKRKPIAAAANDHDELQRETEHEVHEDESEERVDHPRQEQAQQQDQAQQPLENEQIQPLPCLGTLCLRCTELGLKNRGKCYISLLILGVMTSILVAGSIAIGITFSELEGNERTLPIKVPPLTVYQYPLEKSELIRNQGVKVKLAINNDRSNTGLIQIALHNKQLGRKKVTFQEPEAKAGSTLIRYWPAGTVTGNITCKESSTIKAKRTSSTNYSDFGNNCTYNKFNLTTDVFLNIKEFNCSEGFVQAERISNSINTKNGEIVVICLSGPKENTFSVNFTENLYSITNGIFLDIQVGGSTEPAMLTYKNLISELSEIEAKPFLYISTEYVQYSNKHSKKRIGMKPVSLNISFSERPSLWGYYTGVILISSIPFVIVLLISYCFYKDREKKACTIGCLYRLH